jgi:hypothetical protein
MANVYFNFAPEPIMDHVFFTSSPQWKMDIIKVHSVMFLG